MFEDNNNITFGHELFKNMFQKNNLEQAKSLGYSICNK
jgi:hypothetical protein